MKVYFCGVGGVGIGPLAEIAQDAGYEVIGSDQTKSLMSKQLENRGISVNYEQTKETLIDEHEKGKIDWFVYTSALPEDHSELLQAKELGIRTSKRDGFLAELLRVEDKKMVAVAGTHGKTTTTGILIWAFKALGKPLSYAIGTTISYGASGYFDSASEYFIYECDEFDRNFLHFEPSISLITALDHDHVDTYPTVNDYRNAFVQFLEQSNMNVMWERDLQYLAADPAAEIEAYDEHMDLAKIKLAGTHVRQNAYLASRVLLKLFPDLDESAIYDAINSFPGTSRRFEKLAENLYSDYGHHPVEIAATLQLAREVSNDVVLVYQPHQNVRQHEIRDQYTDCMELANEIYWLPTYLSREDPGLEVLTPQQLTEKLSNEEVLHFVELDEELWINIKRHLDAGRLVLAMGAGDIDTWLRVQLEN